MAVRNLPKVDAPVQFRYPASKFDIFNIVCYTFVSIKSPYRREVTGSQSKQRKERKVNIARKTLIILVLFVIGALVLAACGPVAVSSEQIAGMRASLDIMRGQTSQLERDINVTRKDVSQLKSDLYDPKGLLTPVLAEVRAEIDGLKKQPSGIPSLRNEVERLKSESQLYRSTRSWTSDGASRNVLIDQTYDVKIQLARLFLEKGRLGEAKVLTIVAISELGIISCDRTKAVVNSWDLPEELVELVKDDISPLYSIKKVEGERFEISYQSPNPGC